MSSPELLLHVLRTQMRAAGVTYKMLAERIAMSESSVKRMFGQQDMTLSRLAQICKAAGVPMEDVLRGAADATPQADRLTLTQQIQDASRAEYIVLTLGTPALGHIEIDVSQIGKKRSDKTNIDRLTSECRAQWTPPSHDRKEHVPRVDAKRSPRRRLGKKRRHFLLQELTRKREAVDASCSLSGAVEAPIVELRECRWKRARIAASVEKPHLREVKQTLLDAVHSLRQRVGPCCLHEVEGGRGSKREAHAPRQAGLPSRSEHELGGRPQHAPFATDLPRKQALLTIQT